MGLLELPPVSTCVIKVGLNDRPKQKKLFSCQLKILLNLLCWQCSDEENMEESLAGRIRNILFSLGGEKLIAT